MLKILTGCWFTKVPPGYVQIGISRGSPRGHAAGYRKFGALAPGPWFKSCATPAEYLERYNEILGKLDPQQTLDVMTDLANGKTPVMCCFEHVPKINSGETWCHRHIVAQWLEDKLGIEVPELGHKDVDRFAKLRLANIAEPTYR